MVLEDIDKTKCPEVIVFAPAEIQSNTYLTSNSEGTGDGTHPNEAGYRRYYVPQLIALFESIMPRLTGE